MNPIQFSISVDPSIDPAELAQKIIESFQAVMATRMAETPEEESASMFAAPIIDAPPEAQVIAIISRLFDVYDRAAISPEAWDRIGNFTKHYTTEKRVFRGVPTAATS